MYPPRRTGLKEFNPELYQEKYRIKSTRLSYWDYSSDGWYFVTICTKNRREYFGEIRNGIMGLNEMGCIANEQWVKTAKLRKNVFLDEWVIMPNHVHGIIIINNATVKRIAMRLYGVLMNRGIQTDSDHNVIIWHPLCAVLNHP